MARSRVPLVALALASALVAPAAAPAAAPVRAGFRVISGGGPSLGAESPLVGAARAYLDADGAPHALPADTAMGQLVAAGGAWGFGVRVKQFGDAGFVDAIAGRAGGASGFWALYVNGVASQVGASDVTLHRGDEIVWLRDPDFNVPGPTFLDADAFRTSGGYRVLVRRAGIGRPVPAAGATLVVRGRVVRADARGVARIAVAPGTAVRVRAHLAGSFPSEILTLAG